MFLCCSTKNTFISVQLLILARLKTKRKRYVAHSLLASRINQIWMTRDDYIEYAALYFTP